MKIKTVVLAMFCASLLVNSYEVGAANCAGVPEPPPPDPSVVGPECDEWLDYIGDGSRRLIA